jgi:hypothetical protein
MEAAPWETTRLSALSTHAHRSRPSVIPSRQLGQQAHSQQPGGNRSRNRCNPTHMNGYAFFLPTGDGVDSRGGITGAIAIIKKVLYV